MRVFVIDGSSLPYDLNESNYQNSPGNYENSSGNYENSVGNYSNSPGNYKNSRGNYENGMSGSRRLITERNEFLGYYVYSDHGVLNFYNASGKRIAFMPKGGHTTSVFGEREWCGTVGEDGGELVLGLTQGCFMRAVLDR